MADSDADPKPGSFAHFADSPSFRPEEHIQKEADVMAGIMYYLTKLRTPYGELDWLAIARVFQAVGGFYLAQAQRERDDINIKRVELERKLNAVLRERAASNLDPS